MSASGLLRIGSITLDDLDASHARIKQCADLERVPPRTIVWLVPLIDHALRGGVRTIFTFAEHMSKTHGTLNTFVFCSLSNHVAPLGPLAESIAENFPHTRFTVRAHRHFPDDIR